MLAGARVRLAQEIGFDGTNHPSAATLKADGIDVAFLYAGTPGSSSGKDFTAAQYADYRSHGIRRAFVFEHLPTDWTAGPAGARANAHALLADLAAKGTDGTDPVAVSVDQHVPSSDLPRVVAYATAFAVAIRAAGYKGPVGVYGFSEVLIACHAAGAVQWYWGAGSRSSMPLFVNVWQDNTKTIVVGGSADDEDWILIPLPQETDDMALNEKLPPIKLSDGKEHTLTVADVLRGLAQLIAGDVAEDANTTGHPAGQYVSRILAIDTIASNVAAIQGALPANQAALIAAITAAGQHVDVELSDAQVSALSGPIVTELAALPGAVRLAIGQALVAQPAGS